MALVYLHLDRCKGTPKWRMRKSLKQNGVREERREGWRQKGKTSFPSRRPTGLLSKSPTDGFCHELNEVTRGETTQAKRARDTSSPGVCREEIVSRNSRLLAALERIAVLCQHRICYSATNLNRVCRRVFRESPQNRELRRQSIAIRASGKRDACVFLHAVHRVINVCACRVAHEPGNGTPRRGSLLRAA